MSTNQNELIEQLCIRMEIMRHILKKFGVEHISKEIKKFTGNKYITANTYRIQA